MKKSLLSALILVSSTVFAHTEFVGNIKGTTDICSIEVEQTYFEGNIETAENFRADVVVSLADDGHGDHLDGDVFSFTLKASSKPNMLSAVGANGHDLLNVLVAAGSQGLENPTAFAIKWLHGNHFHTAQCLNLVKKIHE
jgi:hypothetical protein